MSASLDRRESAVQQRVVRELIGLIPKSWSSVTMEVTRNLGAAPAMELAYVIRSPEGHRQVLSPTEAIYESVHELADLYDREHVGWARAKYVVEKDANGDWDFRVGYEYPPGDKLGERRG